MFGVSDRSTKINGEYTTIPTLIDFARTQQKIAFDNKLLYWNLFEAMGGKNSMIELVNKKLANKDYTHLTHGGGTVVSTYFLKSFLYEMDKYKKRKKSSV